MNQTYTLDLSFIDRSLYDNEGLRRLLRPRVHRRVSTSVLGPIPGKLSTIGFSYWLKDGWEASGVVVKLPEGDVKVVYTTSWTNTRENGFF